MAQPQPTRSTPGGADELTHKMIDGLTGLARDMRRQTGLGVAPFITIVLGDVPVMPTPVGQVVYDPHGDTFDIWESSMHPAEFNISREEILARIEEM